MPQSAEEGHKKTTNSIMLSNEMAKNGIGGSQVISNIHQVSTMDPMLNILPFRQY